MPADAGDYSHVGPQDKRTYHYISGPIMASSNNLRIRVNGVGGHSSNRRPPSTR